MRGINIMSELTWYSRFAVLVGAAILLVQSVAGRGSGPMSLLSVILVGGGLLGFLGGLVWDARAPATHEGRVETYVEVSGAENVEPGDAVRSDEELPIPSEPALLTPSRGHAPNESSDAGDQQTAQPVDTVPSPTVQVTAAESARPLHGTVRTREIVRGSWLSELPCVRCTRPLGIGSTVAICPVCERPQHASCWIDNRFRCSAPGCAGRGSLEAPEPMGDA